MADLFTSFVAISPNQSKVGGKQAERTPGTSPAMKDGIWNERACAITTQYPKLGHILDTDTAALWRLNTLGVGPSGTTPDLGSSEYALTNFQTPPNDVRLVASPPTSVTNPPTIFGSTPTIDGGGYLWPIPSTGVFGLSGAAVSGPDIAAVQNAMTVEAWIFWQGAITWPTQTICALSGGGAAGNSVASVFTFQIQPTASLSVVYASTASPGFWTVSDGGVTPIPVHVWMHVAYRRRFADGVWHHEFFNNGVLVKDDFNSRPPGNPGSGLSYRLFGGSQNGTTDTFQGTIDDVRVSKVARSDAQILESYRRGLGAT